MTATVIAGPFDEDTIVEFCNKFRADLLEKEKALMTFKNGCGNQIPEVMANFMLAYRHLEDCRMRMGKVIQAANGGISIYDKK